VPNLTVYERTDYRRFLSAHLQYLQRLCQFSQKSVNNSINELLTSLFVTTKLLSEIDFVNRVNNSIEQSKSNAPVLLSRLLLFTQSSFHANAFVSLYGTNFEYSAQCQDDENIFVPAEAVIYDDGCSCGMYANCTTQANFIETNSVRNISIKGMKMGCTPSESFLSSTLECFYDQSCLDLIQQYTNYSKSLNPLSTISSRFSPNTTINELVKNSFIEDWPTAMNYSSYYKQCSPSLCSYTYVENFSVLYIITVILGIQGGLTIVLKWICPKLVRIASKIYYKRKNRIDHVRPIDSFAISSNETTNTIIQHTTWNSEIKPMNLTSRSRLFFKMIFVVIVVCILLGVTFFSIHYARQSKNKSSLYLVHILID